MSAGDGHQTGNITLQQVGTGDAGEHGDHDGAGLCRRTQLIGRCGQNQHLDGAVVLQGIPVILQADLDRFAGAKNSERSLGAMEITAMVVKIADMMAVIFHRVSKNSRDA